MQGEAVAGLGVGVIRGRSDLEGAFCLAVSKLDGDGILAVVQPLQEALLQGDDGVFSLFQGVVLFVDSLAVDLQTFKILEHTVGGKDKVLPLSLCQMAPLPLVIL